MADAASAAADTMIAELGARARAAARIVARASTVSKAEAIRAAAAALRARADSLLAANAEDVASAEEAGTPGAMLDRLMLTPARIEGMAAALEMIAALPDPVGARIDRAVRPNGLALERVRVPLGLIGIIYESRPNVTADAGALCLMAGNAVMLRGGSDAARSSAAIHVCLIEGLRTVNLPEDAVQLVPSGDRALVGGMLRASGLIDVIVPRGGKGLVARVQAEARVPVLAHLDGMNTTYVHAAADPAKAERVVLDAKLRRTGVCGATETLLIDRAYPAAARLIGALIEAGCEVRGTTETQALDTRVIPAGQADWRTEYLDAILSVAVVGGLDEAIAHIAAHGSGHTDAILTEDAAVAARFLAEVDSAIVMHNASSQFADGGEFGLGAEIGIATGRLHARGPVALEGLTTYKWLVRGDGQARG